MKLYYNNRSRARAFAQKNPNYKLRDMGSNAPAGRRWAVEFAPPRQSDNRAAA